ncbi:Retrovirus-related Pol polyprotein from transposon TNT 1-94 [Vitis vinifera]|uniref:Retrovirus-related Pol polyprotein from transposon TNT 1-94 n=1 Tax=Vitis vinifera TaxID=29760 RepID=A0A438E8N4_VITVI|nr:Retrovirus-related Pol polyprotein from transposon TNT 1-94 [Vitis vinifera]
MDVKIAFLNGDLEEEIYMDQPEGCVVPRKEKNVFICLYIDDMLIFGTNLEVVCETKKFLGSKFDMKDLGEAEDHWTVVRRVLKYLRGTINYGLCFSGFPSVLEGFSDANWILDSDEMKSTSGYVFILGGSAVSWKSAKQTCITQSIMEAKFIALENASSEVEWLRNLLTDIPLWTRPALSMSICCDSQAAIAKAKRVISLEFVRSKLNLADSLTKPLNKKLVEETSRGMGLMPITEVKSCDRVYSALTKVECLLLMNTIFLMDVKTEESYEESWANLRSHLPRVNPDCKEKKQRESAMKPILDDSRSQQSNASNGVQFGVETRKLQPLQANHSELKEAFCKVLRNHPFVAK